MVTGLYPSSPYTKGAATAFQACDKHEFFADWNLVAITDTESPPLTPCSTLIGGERVVSVVRPTTLG